MDHQVVRERQPLRDVQARFVHELPAAVGRREGSCAERAESAVTKATALSVGGRRAAARRVT